MKKLMAVTALSMLFAVPALAETMAPASKSEDMFYSQRGEWRVNKMIGVKVVNAAGDTVGDINELLIDKNGVVSTAIIGVGGYLGVGERHAAITYSTLRIAKGSGEAPAASLNMTKDELKATPEWKWTSGNTEWRASKLVGAKVTNVSNETIGDINDMLIDKDGKVTAAIIGVGGYLGLGERHAAVAFNALQLTRDASGNALAHVNLTKDQLKSAPEWKSQGASLN